MADEPDRAQALPAILLDLRPHDQGLPPPWAWPVRRWHAPARMLPISPNGAVDYQQGELQEAYAVPYALLTATPAQDSVPKTHVLDMEVWSLKAGNGPY